MAVLPPGHRRGGGLATTVAIVCLAAAVYAAGWVGGTASSSTADAAYVVAVVAGSLAVLFGVIGFIFWRRPVPFEATFDETVNRVVRFLGGVEQPTRTVEDPRDPLA